MITASCGANKKICSDMHNRAKHEIGARKGDIVKWQATPDRLRIPFSCEDGLMRAVGAISINKCEGSDMKTGKILYCMKMASSAVAIVSAVRHSLMGR